MTALPRLALFAAVASIVACQNEPAPPPTWSELEGVPADFKDGKDDVRTDEEIRQVATEGDPLFAASPASVITSDDVTNWDDAYGWGNHALAGYLKGSALTANSVPLWNGTQLVDSAIAESNGNVGISAAPGTIPLTVSTLAKFGVPMETNTTKSCAISGSRWTHTPPSATACNTYCTGLGFVSGAVTAVGPKSCAGASCDYISDFDTCAMETMPNDNACDSCATSFVCTCQEPGVELTGAVRVMSGNLGVGVAAPKSPLQVGGYIQLGTTSGAPPVADCDETAERARMMIDPATSLIWVCGNTGWVSK